MDFSSFTLPDWALTDEAKAWAYGFFVMAFVRIFRAALRWFRGSGRVDTDG